MALSRFLYLLKLGIVPVASILFIHIELDLYIFMQYFTGFFIMLCFTTTKK